MHPSIKTFVSHWGEGGGLEIQRIIWGKKIHFYATHWKKKKEWMLIFLQLDIEHKEKKEYNNELF